MITGDHFRFRQNSVKDLFCSGKGKSRNRRRGKSIRERYSHWVFEKANQPSISRFLALLARQPFPPSELLVDPARAGFYIWDT